MNSIRVLVGTRKGAFILSSDVKRQRWDISGPHFAGWEIYHLKGSPVNPNRLYASQSNGWFGQVIQRSDDGGKTWEEADLQGPVLPICLTRFRFPWTWDGKATTIQSRATGGVVNATFVFVLPGSPGACRDAWDGILKAQFDYRHMPCNFVEIMPRLDEHLRRGKG